MPTVRSELLGGRTNRSFLVERDGYKAVVRINAAHSASLGIDRNLEIQILQLLQPLGCVPAITYADAGSLVTRFVEGEHRQIRPVTAQPVLDLLRKIQRVTVPDTAPRFSYLRHCTSYADQIVPSGNSDTQLIRESLELARNVDNADWQPVICHHDLVPENILWTANGPVLLDWEYAAFGHPDIDRTRLFTSAEDSRSTSTLHRLINHMDSLWSRVHQPGIKNSKSAQKKHMQPG